MKRTRNGIKGSNEELEAMNTLSRFKSFVEDSLADGILHAQPGKKAHEFLKDALETFIDLDTEETDGE